MAAPPDGARRRPRKSGANLVVKCVSRKRGDDDGGTRYGIVRPKQNTRSRDEHAFPLRILPCCLRPAGSAAPPCPAQTAAQAPLLARALDATRAGDWDEAQRSAARTGSRIAATSSPGRGCATARATGRSTAVPRRHPDWPGLQTLRRAGERQMPEGMPPARSSPSSAASRRRPAPGRCGSRRRWRPAAARTRPRPRSPGPGASSR